MAGKREANADSEDANKRPKHDSNEKEKATAHDDKDEDAGQQKEDCATEKDKKNTVGNSDPTVSDDANNNKTKEKTIMPTFEETEDFEAIQSSFPERLMDLLQGGDGEVHEAINWLPGGEAFSIVTAIFPKLVLDKHFYGTKFESFTRKLNRWGFKRLAAKQVAPDCIAYQHALFKRDQPELVKMMRSGKNRHVVPEGTNSAPVRKPSAAAKSHSSQQHQGVMGLNHHPNHSSTLGLAPGAMAGGSMNRLDLMASPYGVSMMGSFDASSLNRSMSIGHGYPTMPPGPGGIFQPGLVGAFPPGSLSGGGLLQHQNTQILQRLMSSSQQPLPSSSVGGGGGGGTRSGDDATADAGSVLGDSSQRTSSSVENLLANQRASANMEQEFRLHHLLNQDQSNAERRGST